MLVPKKVRAFSNTYGYVKSGEQQKSWVSPSYLGYFGPKRSKFGPNDQRHNKRPKEPNKVTFPCGLRP